MPRLNLKQIVAALPTAQTIVLPDNWFEDLPDAVSVFEHLYGWMTKTRGVNPIRIHNRTYVGATLAKRLRTAERRRIGTRRKLTGENLEKALNWSDFGAGPLSMFGVFEIIGEALFVVHQDQESAAQTVAYKLFDEHRTRQNGVHQKIASGANFWEWLTSNSERDDVIGDLAKDVLKDPQFPRNVVHYHEALVYLRSSAAVWEALDSLADAWLEYACRYKDRIVKTAWCAMCGQQISDLADGYLVVSDEGNFECCHRSCVFDTSSSNLPLVRLLETDWVDALIDFGECRGVPRQYVADAERRFRLWGFGLDDNVPRTIVYFIQAGTSGRIKIGYSGGQASKRLASLQTGSSEPLRLLAEIDGNRNTESELHRRFSAHRKSGEWFEPHPELIAYISVLRAGSSTGSDPAGQLR